MKGCMFRVTKVLSIYPYLLCVGDLNQCLLSCLGPLVLLLPKLCIIYLFCVLILSVPDEGYSKNALGALNLTSTFLLLHIILKSVLLY